MTLDIRFTESAAKHIPPTAHAAMSVPNANIGDELLILGPYAPPGTRFVVVEIAPPNTALVDLKGLRQHNPVET